MDAALSFWEVQSWIEGIDICVIGSGIVGLNAAIHAKWLNPKARVVVVERGYFPLGASTKNAGFACFGSITELLDDLTERSLDEVMETVALRWQGLKLLKQLLGEKNIGYEHFGSYEIFLEKDEGAFIQASNNLELLNDAIKEVLGEREVFRFSHSTSIKYGMHGVPHLIYNRLEGQIDTGMMMRNLLKKAYEVGIEIWNGIEVLGMEEGGKNVRVITAEFDFEVGSVIVATNAFTQKIFPKLQVKPSRNQVLITKPIPGLKLRGCFHYQKGYGYLRNVKDRVLIGGWRHLDFEKESTAEFGGNDIIREELEKWLRDYILKGQNWEIEHAWSGILGIGQHKHPIIERVGERIVAAVRLGGMGIAIGSIVGQKAAELLLN